ncbi:MAG: acyl-CoA dehydrogenase [Candidatus Abyssobacteria bacterium SURF_5]|uniref:Acyl-CoA dehydrogenase n=1 Tax=Abyssobacteria bacterium (strain SURF_5) TaxID=2093360 RepID=A0A3A4NPQ5_ABYX5|nr:MAG: acyl-CoA dehydrogenase [Candidatus Abyssubacteria bacterium SURF_5]
MIDFELPEQIVAAQKETHQMALKHMRPIAREYDEREHEKPWDYISVIWEDVKKEAADQLALLDQSEEQQKDARKRSFLRAGGQPMILTAILAEERAWGDAGINLCNPGPRLGGAAINAVGTPSQKRRFFQRFTEGPPKWGAMAITEANAGSDTAAITCTATRDGDSWILNGEKIFVTSGKMACEESDGFVVVWATIDKAAGRAGIKSFVVEKGTPGMTVTKLEHKLGIRASDTATVIFEDCRIPLDNILGSPEVQQKGTTKGFKGVMATFDATRPGIAAGAIGIGRAALEFVKEKLAEQGIEVRYGISPYKMNAVEKDIHSMEANLKAARLLTWRACWMLDRKERNSLQASMAKAKAGLAVTHICQKAVELMGPLGYSREYLLEKWMRDCKINDIFEGTGQINMLIVARNILGYGRDLLK